ncbi:MAG TPA: tetratricopeptide repeat protein [Burkholderiaceae bacterium]|nr:tetratricopeptide repeat protein [Burkholderiaceae bacterium]
MSGQQPYVSAGINGTDVRFLLDTGAMFSTIAPAAADGLGLRRRRAPDNLRVYGVGGRADIDLTRVERFTLKRTTFENIEFIVGGSRPGSSGVGLLGQNFLGGSDVEYDLANGAMRLHYPNEDCKTAGLAYWAKSQPVIEVDLEQSRGSYLSRLVAYASVNGVRMQVLFDTGASVSILSLRAAERVGLSPTAEGVVGAGAARGMGSREISTWIGPVKSFALGGEQITDTRLRFGDFSLNADMLLGADFFLSHRLYFAKSQGKVYFTYNGGPVFNLTAAASVAGDNRATGDSASAAVDEQSTPTSADGYSRRAAGFVSRKDFQRALLDYNRACEMEPGVAKHFTQRGRLHLAMRQPSSALSDFNQAIRLDPNDTDARLARAGIHATNRDTAAARDDLAAIDSIVAARSEIRLNLARAYLQMQDPAAALVQLNHWIPAHSQEYNIDEALNSRCWARALLGSELEQALSDCNAALKAKRTSARYGSRGLVHLRMGSFDKAIDDYDEALRIDPKSAWSLLGRGIARIRKGAEQAGRADIAAAKAIRSSIEAEAAHYGVGQ